LCSLPSKISFKNEKEFTLEKVAIHLPEPCKPFRPVPDCLEPSIEEFVADFMVPGHPVVLTGRNNLLYRVTNKG